MKKEKRWAISTKDKRAWRKIRNADKEIPYSHGTKNEWEESNQ